MYRVDVALVNGIVQECAIDDLQVLKLDPTVQRDGCFFTDAFGSHAF